MGTKSAMATGEDVVGFLKAQHEQVKALFEETVNAAGKAREDSFLELRRAMAVHETAEEEIVHPVAARALLHGGEALIAELLKEENGAKKTLAELEALDVNSTEFDTKIRTLQAAVLAHAEKEETQEFSKLGEALDHKHLLRMRRAVEIAESMAPTRPHPGLESATANFLVGPFAAMMDRTRDALHSESRRS